MNSRLCNNQHFAASPTAFSYLLPSGQDGSVVLAPRFPIPDLYERGGDE